MLSELFYKLYTCHRQLVGSGAIIVLFLAALLLFARSEKKIAPLILSPLTAVALALMRILGALFGNDKERRFLRIIKGAFATCLLVLAVALSGGDLIFGDMASKASNDMHIPGDLPEAMTAVLEDGKSPHVLTMPGWGVYFESFSSAFDMMYEDPPGDDPAFSDEDQWLVYTQLGVLHPDMKKVAAAAHRTGCEYVVLSNDIWPEFPITSFGYETFYKGDLCTVYREVAGP